MMPDKKTLRALVRAQTEALPQSYLDEADRAIMQKLLESHEYKSAERVFAYYSVGREVSTHKIIERALSDGKRVALPVSLPGGKMLFREIRDTECLRPGAYGIPEPDESCAPMECRSGDLVLVPAVSCDAKGSRLGRGAGYYDRFLQDRDCVSVCLMRSALMQESIPTDAHDVPVKLVINEK